MKPSREQKRQIHKLNQKLHRRVMKNENDTKMKPLGRGVGDSTEQDPASEKFPLC